ncbi:ABC transporter permease [Streptomyces sp. NPDC059853]|uniref:ABC transporter permease n=1 Tax=Streptomyces sp. NPDC059853 TaxID=3346973 RepID=UPI00364C0DD9
MWQTNRRAYPWTYFTSTVLAGALTMVLAYFAFVAGGRRVSATFSAYAGSGDYLGYIAVGAITYAFAVRMLLWTAKALITEEREGTIVALLVAPATRVPYMIGFASFALVSTLAEAGALTVVALLIGVAFPTPHLLGLVVGVGIFTLALFSMSLILGAVMLFASEAHISQNTLFLVMGLVCGFTFPREYLPSPLQWLAETLPVTPALDVLREGLSGVFDIAETGPRMAACLALCSVYLLASWWLLPRAERRVMERTF